MTKNNSNSSIFLSGCTLKNDSAAPKETAEEITEEATEEISEDSSENNSIRKNVYVCKVVSVDSEYVELSYGGKNYKISAEDCDWVNEGDTVDLTFTNDNLEKIGDNSYLVTDGFLSPFMEYVEK